MGILVEFNPDLALRKFGSDGREADECFPETLVVGEVYGFLKRGQRLYWINDDKGWLKGELPLSETSGLGELSRPLASVKILEATHFPKDGEVWTKGMYEVKEVFNPEDSEVKFESYRRIR